MFFKYKLLFTLHICNQTSFISKHEAVASFTENISQPDLASLTSVWIFNGRSRI